MTDNPAAKYVQKTRHFLRLDRLPKPVRKAVVFIAGGILLIAGVIMIVTPGPALILIPASLLLLATEFQWAQRCVDKGSQWLHRLREKWQARKRRRQKAAPFKTARNCVKAGAEPR